MKKNLYYQLTDNGGMNVTAPLEDCMKIIESAMDSNKDIADEIEFTLQPIMMTEEEYRAMPESDSY